MQINMITGNTSVSVTVSAPPVPQNTNVNTSVSSTSGYNNKSGILEIDKLLSVSNITISLLSSLFQRHKRRYYCSQLAILSS